MIQQSPPPHSPSTTTPSTTSTTSTTTPKHFYILIPISTFSILLFLSISSTSSPPPSSDPYLFPSSTTHQTLFLSPNSSSSDQNISDFPPPPSIAYFLSGSSSDLDRIIRLLFSTYHPKNLYLLHLDRFAPQTDRDNLALTVQSVPIFEAAKNVHVIGKADFSYKKGSTFISSTLRGASILLRLSENWDWFINLNAKDYPLVTQDDLLHILSYLPKNLNFVNHTSYIGWREKKKLKPIIVDPGLYLTEKTGVFYTSQKRDLPNAFRVFTGSSSAILSREFIEFCILGTDNLPRTLLMYLSNVPSSLPNYFPTILCNSKQFNKTIINDNLQYTSSKNSSNDLRPLGSADLDDMIGSGAAFATEILDTRVLDCIDRDILRRNPNEPVPGGWCLGESGNNSCSVWGNANILRPGHGSKSLESRIVELLSNGSFHTQQCRIE